MLLKVEKLPVSVGKCKGKSVHESGTVCKCKTFQTNNNCLSNQKKKKKFSREKWTSFFSLSLFLSAFTNRWHCKRKSLIGIMKCLSGKCVFDSRRRESDEKWNYRRWCSLHNIIGSERKVQENAFSLDTGIWCHVWNLIGVENRGDLLTKKPSNCDQM